MQNIEKSFEKLDELESFREKYAELFTSLINLKKTLAIEGFGVDKISFQSFLQYKYPHLILDMEKIGLDRLLGFEIERFLAPVVIK